MATTKNFSSQNKFNQWIVRKIEENQSKAEADEAILTLLISCIRDEGHIDKVRFGEVLADVHSEIDEIGPESAERRAVMNDRFAFVRELLTSKVAPDLKLIDGGVDDDK